jgi:PEP-CTERM motif
MRISIISIKPLALGLALIGLMTFAGTVKADEVHVAGFTNGCFGAGCTPGASATILGLTYSNSTFAGTTAAGLRGLGGNANPGSNFNNLGSFTLSTAPNTYNSTFSLQVTFTAPQGIDGSSTAIFFATLTGTVVSDNIGGVKLTFDNGPVLFTFNDPNCETDPTGGIPGQQTTCGIGSFFFSVNNLAIDPGQMVSLTGQITSAQQSAIPEPASMFLLGTGLAGAAALARRKMKNINQ